MQTIMGHETTMRKVQARNQTKRKYKKNVVEGDEREL
jgi:hypothetical protein